MGWSFAYSTSTKRADVVAMFRGDKYFSGGYKLIDSRVVGNHFWGVLQHPSGLKTIFLGLMSGGGRNMGWGYKTMDETAGPAYYDCPLSLLRQASDLCEFPEGMDRHAAGWREKVIELAAKKKVAKKPVIGLVVKYGDHQYKLVHPVAPRKGWTVVRVDTGAEYRMRATQLSKALRGDYND